MSDYFTASGDPADDSALDSSVVRAEITNIAAGFAKIAGYTGAGSRVVFINTGATAQSTDSAFTYNSSTDVLTVNTSTFGLNTSIAGTLGITGALTYGGVALTAAVTGTGKMVLDTSPTIATPVINSAAHVGGSWVADATWTVPALTLGGTVSGGGNQINNVTIGTSTPLAGAFTTLSATGALTYGGVTLTAAVTGTGKMVLDTSPTLVTPILGIPTSGTLTNCTGTATGLTVGHTTGNATNTTLPAFLVYSPGEASLTGDGTNNGLTLNNEIFDQGGNFAANIFTAPVTGKYQFNYTIYANGITAGMTQFYATIITSNRTYAIVNIGACGALGGTQIYSGSVLADMDATDTATVAILVDGGAKVVSVNALTCFSGFLAC